MSDENFLSRWSRRKTEAKVATPSPEEPAPSQPPNVAPSQDGASSPPQPLPPVESLTPESDFTPFMQAGVDPGVKRAALKHLLRDPRFNVMDGLDVYIDDYSKPDPLPEGWLEKMEQVKRLGIFKEPVEEAPEAVAEGNAPLQNAMEEQVLAPPAENVSADTPNVSDLPSQVGESAPKPE